jgi:acyl dehydratase
MPLSTAMVGQQTQPFVHPVDARWLMAYAAGIEDRAPAYLDTAAAPIAAHPAFPVCLEWPAILGCAQLPGAETSSAPERARSVHANHDLHLHRPIRAGDVLSTTATVLGVRMIKPGAAQTTRLDTVDADGNLVCRTYQLGISRGVEISGDPAESEAVPELPVAPSLQDSGGPESIEMPVARGAAHIYTECARIWNPIHTDRAVALAAGLPDIILHGTATMAMAVSRIVERVLEGDPTRVRRLGGRFSSMVFMPSTPRLVIHGVSEGVVGFTVFTEDGRTAFSDGFLCFD